VVEIDELIRTKPTCLPNREEILAFKCIVHGCTPEKRRNGSDSLPCVLKARQKYLKDASIGYRCPTSFL
jgi:hypothetical protein